MVDDIIRENPYPAQNQTDATVPSGGSIPEVNIVGNPPQQNYPAGEGGPVPNGSPMSNQSLANNQIKSLENRKLLTSQGAEMEGKGKEAESLINTNAAADNLKNQQESAIALQKAMGDADKRDKALRLQIQQAAAKVPDPDHWWNSKSTGGQIAAVMGMVLGAVGVGMSRHGEGHNYAADRVHEAIDRDMLTQKDAIANNWKGIAATHELDDTAFNRELHNQTWQNNYRTAGFERVKYDLASAAAKTGSQTVRQNALVGIQDMSDAQDKIKNQQYLLGQSAVLANLKRMRELGTAAGKDVQARVDKGATQEAAEQSVYSQPNYRELLHAGMAPQSVMQIEVLKNQFQGEVAAVKRQAAMINLFPGSPGYDALVGGVEKNPKYAPLIQSMNQGRIVPNDKDIEHRTSEDRLSFEQGKDARERTVTIGGQDYLDRNPKRAEETATAVHSAEEVKRINDRIMELRNENGVLGPSKRAELNTLLGMGQLHYPRMQTGSTRINEMELKQGAKVYDDSDWIYRGDPLKTSEGKLRAISKQADDRIKEAMDGLTPTNKQGPGIQQGPPSVQQMNQSLGATPIGKK